MTLVDLVLGNAIVVALCMALLWALSIAWRNASIVDIFWGFGFVVVAWISFVRTGSERALLLAGLTSLWGLRLSLYLAVRNAGKPEDARYQALRARYAPFWWKSIFIVFGLQGVLLLLVSLPLPIAARDPQPLLHGGAAATALTVAGVALFACGFVVEALADLQLRRFKSDPANRGKVMDRGLWSWSRHPNYFGEMVLWWGLGLVALPAPLGPLALVGPATITFLLLRVSGVPMLEEQMKKRGPDYAAYVARTNAFFPRPPRKASVHTAS